MKVKISFWGAAKAAFLGLLVVKGVQKVCDSIVGCANGVKGAVEGTKDTLGGLSEGKKIITVETNVENADGSAPIENEPAFELK